MFSPSTHIIFFFNTQVFKLFEFILIFRHKEYIQFYIFPYGYSVYPSPKKSIISC